MATPKPPVQTPKASVRYVAPDGRLTPEGMQLILAVVQRQNDHETRLSALEP